MRKLMRIRDYALLSAAIAADVFNETRIGWGVMPAAMKNMYGFVPSRWRRTSYTQEVSRMLSTGDIIKVIDNKGKVYLELTSSGKDKFKRRFSLFLQDKKWNGYFMIVVYDIAEETKDIRKSVMYKLEELGFGMMQKSVWISPYHFESDMRELIEEKGLHNEVFVLSARKLWLGDLKSLAKKIWKLNSVNKGYLGVINRVKKTDGVGKRKRERLIKKAIQGYLEILSKDPLLPKEFLPADWAREEAVKSLNSILS